MTQIGTSLRAASRLAKPYFRSEQPIGFRIGGFDLGRLLEKWIGRGFLVIILAIDVDQWNGRFYNALQGKDLAAFTRKLGIFAVLAAIFIALAVYELYLTQWLVLRWRMWLTHTYLDRWTDGAVHYRMRIRRPLAGLNAEQQRREANFRFGLVRLREIAEPVAQLSGEAAERRDLKGRFTGIIDNTLSIMRRRKLLTFFSAGYQQFSVVAPFLLLSPAYYSGGIGLGSLTQTARALGNIQGTLSIFVSLYAMLAEYNAVVARLSGFDEAIEQASRSPSSMTTDTKSAANGFRLHDVVERRSDGAVLLRVPELEALPGDHILISGPTGAGKNCMIRFPAHELGPRSWP